MEQCRGTNMVGKVSSQGIEISKACRCGWPGLGVTFKLSYVQEQFCKNCDELINYTDRVMCSLY